MTKPYGITWGNTDHSVAQTGYDFDTIEEAKAAAYAGPWAYDGRVDAMCVHYPEIEPGPLWGNIEDEDDTITWVLIAKFHPYEGGEQWITR